MSRTVFVGVLVEKFGRLSGRDNFRETRRGTAGEEDSTNGEFGVELTLSGNRWKGKSPMSKIHGGVAFESYGQVSI